MKILYSGANYVDLNWEEFPAENESILQVDLEKHFFLFCCRPQSSYIIYS